MTNIYSTAIINAVSSVAVRGVTKMATDAQRKAIAKYQSEKARVNIWMSPEGKEQLTEYAKNTPEKSVQKYLLRLIKDESGIDCETINND